MTAFLAAISFPLGVLAIVVGVLVVGRRALPVVTRVLDSLDRIIGVYERDRAIQTQPPEASDPMPADLAGTALNESEGWAREAVIKRLWEDYGELRDWNKVRHRLLERTFATDVTGQPQ